MRVLLVGGEAQLRRAAIECLGGLEVLHTETSALLSSLSQEPPFDVAVLLASSTRELAPLDALSATHAALPVLVLGATDDDQLATSCLRRGAEDYRVVGDPSLRRALLHAGERRRATESTRRDLEERALRAERDKRFLEKEREGLRQQELQFNTILAETTDFVAAAGVDLGVRYLNPAGRELLGFKRDEMVFGLSALDLVPAPERSRLQDEILPIALESGRWTGTFELESRTGERILVDAVVILHRSADDSPSFVSVIARDITERARIEERLREAQKIEAVGRLAGGIAHDFNNLLTAISSFGRFALETVGHQHEVYSDLEEILSAAEKAEGLTRQLLAFSRKQAVAPKVFAIAELVSDMERMIQRLLREDVVLETELEQTPWNVRIDPTAMEQVLINLCVNARDAMPHGGRLKVAVSNEKVAAMPSIDIVAGDYVRLSVADEGTGIDPEVLPRIFEPFYTTKEQGKGTGLGLSTCYGVVKQAGGHLDVQSEPGVGSTFYVYLPRVEDEAEPRAHPPAKTKPSDGTGRILVTEDNEQVRRLAARILERRGYEVDVVSNGAEALKLLARANRHFDLLLTDVIMPVMGGRELALQASQLQPDLKVVFMSGFAEDELAEGGQTISGELLLAKPFTPPELLEHVRCALSKSAERLRSA